MSDTNHKTKITWSDLDTDEFHEQQKQRAHDKLQKQADEWERITREAVRTQGLDGALKNDTGKPQLSLIPKEALEEAAKALEYGATKYGRNNFKKGHRWSQLIDAAMRHLSALASGEPLDKESGNTHLSHALASLCMLAYTMKHHPQLNDLYRTYDDITPPGGHK